MKVLRMTDNFTTNQLLFSGQNCESDLVNLMQWDKVTHQAYNKLRANSSNVNLSTTRTAMLLSPIALAACGGSEGEGDGTSAMSTAPLLEQQVSVYGLSTSIEDLALSPSSIVKEAFKFQPAATSFLVDTGGTLYSIFFPTLYYKDPLLPVIVYSASDNKTVDAMSFSQNFSLGNARDYASIKWNGGSDNSIVIIDHGLEYADGTEWPFGELLIATASDGVINFSRISDVKGFYHSVSVGDINGDGLDDIAVIHMGVKLKLSGQDHFSIHTYTQMNSGEFTRTFIFHDDVINTAGYGGGAIYVNDIDLDGSAEIIRAAYIDGFQIFDEGAVTNIDSSFQIFDRNDEGNFILTYTHPRVGSFLEEHGNFGATKIQIFDFNQDGHPDLIMSLEGGVPGLPDKYLANSIEIFQNDGVGGFVRVTEEVLTQHIWLFSELQFREFEVIDVNDDEYPDFVLNGWQGSLFKTDVRSIDLAPLIFINDRGNNFNQLSYDPSIDMSVAGLPREISFVRARENLDGTLDFFAMQSNGIPLTFSVDIA